MRTNKCINLDSHPVFNAVAVFSFPYLYRFTLQLSTVCFTVADNGFLLFYISSFRFLCVFKAKLKLIVIDVIKMTCKNIHSYTKCLLLKYAQQKPSIFDTEQSKKTKKQ